MTRKFKTLGVALFAVLALTAVVASAASAANYTASTYPTTGTATSAKGNDTFITEAGTVECASHFEGTLTAASSTLTVTPTYTSCKAFGFLSAKVVTNGCDYLFAGPSGSADAWSATVNVVCPESKTFVITAPETSPVCTATVGPQGPRSKVDLLNNTGSGDVNVQATVEGIDYRVTQDGFGCPFNGTGAKAGAKYIQDAAITFDGTNGASMDIG